MTFRRLNTCKNRLITIFTVVLGVFNANSQESWNVKVNWEEPAKASKNGKEFLLPQVKGQGFQYNQLLVQEVKELKKGFNYTLKLINFTSADCDQFDIQYLTNNFLDVPSLPEVELNLKNAGEQKLAITSFFPYYKENNQYKKITSVEVSIQNQGAAKPAVAKSFTPNSVLAPGSGIWYRISVKDDGVYRIDKPFLEACGINVNSINPQHINIYGNGEGMLPEDNYVYRTDDLAKNAIVVVGESDGSFDANDYILFYGFGPHRWRANGTADFSRKTNVYSDDSYYYINVNPNATPNRVQTITSSPLAPTHTTSTYNVRAHYEQDLRNLVNGGQRWYGDVFDTELTRTYNFTIPNIDATTQLSFRYALAANVNDTNNRLYAYLNNNLIGNKKLIYNGLDFSRSENILYAYSSSDNLAFRLTMTRISPSVVGYLDYITLNAVRELRFFGSEMSFRYLPSVGAGNITKYSLTNPSGSTIWDITNRQNPRQVITQNVGGSFEFTLPSDTIREFVAFDGSGFKTPIRIGAVAFQNLHATSQTDYVIVSPPQFVEQANRLANLHRANGLDVVVVTPQIIYNEFSSGMQDVVAIRSFLKMFYDRGIANGTKIPKYLLMFGDGIYDPKGRVSNANYLPTYQVINSEDHIASLVSDDFFGFLDDNEGFNNSDMLDVGVGRLLISSTQIAREQVNKVEHYMKNGSSFFQNPGDCDCPSEKSLKTHGDWRTRYVQIADDEEFGYFITQDTEPQNVIINTIRPEMNADKIYLDAYSQISTAGGQRYPDVVDAINDRMRRGALVINYVGHGGEVGVAEERVITVPQIQEWKNNNALTLLVTATCEFTKFDDPNRVSAGEWASLNPKGGAIALMTTTRSVYFSVNSATGKSFFQNVFLRGADSLPLPFGTIIQQTKNGLGNLFDNKRSFTLIGDPALRIAMPHMNMKMDSVFREGSTNKNDTIRALDKITVVGHVEDTYGNVLTGFNGVATPTIYDKPKTFYTLGQDEKSTVLPYVLQKNALYKGQATVTNGYFKMTFIVPKDIDYNFGNGKLGLYANTATLDAFGSDKTIVVGGSNPNGLVDNSGPAIDLYLNDERFVDGGLTDEEPIMIAKVYDENGINAIGNGIGHDITAILDEKSASPYILNEYYISDLDTYQSGRVSFNMPKIEPGEHTITFKVWDVNNNSSEKTIRFTVKEKEKPALSHVLNYPNPFTTRTEFFFEHNQVNTILETQIQIFTVSGRLVKTINQLVNTVGFRTEGIPWDGKDEFGDQLAKGVYVYRVSVRTDAGELAEKFEKLVLLK